MNKSPRRCPQCQNFMHPHPYQMATLDRCGFCALLFLDSMELDYVTGRSLEQALFQDPRLVTHCAHCGKVLNTPSHCEVLQQQSCAGCEQPLYQARVMLRVASQQAEDPYRGATHAGGNKRYENLSYDLKVCLHCHGLLLKEDLFAQLVALFDHNKRR